MLRRTFFMVAVMAQISFSGCSGRGDADLLFPPEDVADLDGKQDGGTAGFDIPPLDRGQIDPGTDGGDAGSTVVDAAVAETGPSGVCPPSCSSNGDCEPCWTAGEDRMGNNYCCTSGLCIYRSGTCDPTTFDGGTSGGRDGGGGFDGFSFDLPPFSFDGFSFDLPPFSFDGFSFDLPRG